MMRYHPITVTAWMFGLSTLALLPFLGRSIVATGWGDLTPAAWGSLAFVILGATVTAYLCVAGSLKKLKPTTVSIYTYLQPVLAIAISVAMGLDKLHLDTVIFALVIFTGVALVLRSYAAHPDAPASRTH